MIEFLTREISIPVYGVSMLWVIVSIGAWVAGRISAMGQYEQGFMDGADFVGEIYTTDEGAKPSDQTQESEND